MSVKIESSNSLKYPKGMHVLFDFDKGHIIFKCGFFSKDKYDVSRIKIELDRKCENLNQYQFIFLDQRNSDQIILSVSCSDKADLNFLENHAVKKMV